MWLPNALYAFVLIAVFAYMVIRERPRLLLTPLMFLSFWVLYGVGHFVYYLRAETVEYISARVTLSLALMWVALVFGAEIARSSLAASAASAARVMQVWSQRSMQDSPRADQLLALVGIFMAIFIFGVFVALGKPSQIAGFLTIDSALEKLKYRLELSGQGGYVYHSAIASVAPFLSFLLLLKGWFMKRPVLFWTGALLALAVVAGKFGTFQKVPWLIYLLQLAIVWQAARSLNLNMGRAIGLGTLILAGAAMAAIVALPELDALGIAEWIGYRFFEINNEVVYQTFYVYPDHIPHTLGMNIGLIQKLFGNGDLVSAHTHVADYFGAFGATFDPFFIGDAWVDFGYYGVFLTSLIVGIIVKALDILALQLGKSPLSVALLGSGLYGLFQLQVTSAFTAFLSGGLLLVPAIAFLSEAVSSRLASSLYDESRAMIRR